MFQQCSGSHVKDNDYNWSRQSIMKQGYEVRIHFLIIYPVLGSESVCFQWRHCTLLIDFNHLNVMTQIRNRVTE